MVAVMAAALVAVLLVLEAAGVAEMAAVIIFISTPYEISIDSLLKYFTC